jgi:PPOX class probable FMN-dependent enzyme
VIDSALSSLEDLHALYGQPGEASLLKVTPALTEAYRRWIEGARFCIISTVGPAGCDASPRGDAGPVVRIQDPQTLLMPDWRGNNRLDTLRNLVIDPRAALMFFQTGNTTVLRVNGKGYVSADPALTQSFEQQEKHPTSVVIFKIEEVYPQCARALMRAQLWAAESQVAAQGLPSIGDMLREISSGAFDGAAYDAEWPARAVKSLW